MNECQALMKRYINCGHSKMEYIDKQKINRFHCLAQFVTVQGITTTLQDYTKIR